MMRTLTSLRGSAIVLTASLALLATPSLQSAHAQEDVVTPALQEFNTLVRENTDNENIINLAQRISVVCPQLTVSFDEDIDVTNPDFTTSVDAGREAGTVEGDLVGRCTGAILTTLGGDIDGGLNILGQLAGEETLGLDTVVSGLNRSQTQVVAARLGAFTAGSAARSVVAETDRPVILASVSYPNAIQSGGTATDANGMAGAFSDETDLGMGWSGYVNGYFSFGEQDPTQLEAGFDFDSYSLSIGADRSVGQRSMLGAALTVGQTDVEFEANAGDTETMAVSISGYGATNFTDQLSASLMASYGFIEHETARRIQYFDGFDEVDRIARGETDGDQFEITGTADYTLQAGALSWGPTARISYIQQNTDGYEETGALGLNLVYDDQESASLTTGIGLSAFYAISTDQGVFVPYGRIEWEHEFDDDARSFAVRYVGDTFATLPDAPASVIQTASPDRDRARLGAGVSTQLAGGLSGFVDYETLLGLEDVSAHTFAVGVRWAF